MQTRSIKDAYCQNLFMTKSPGQHPLRQNPLKQNSIKTKSPQPKSPWDKFPCSFEQNSLEKNPCKTVFPRTLPLLVKFSNELSLAWRNCKFFESCRHFDCIFYSARFVSTFAIFENLTFFAKIKLTKIIKKHKNQ